MTVTFRGMVLCRACTRHAPRAGSCGRIAYFGTSRPFLHEDPREKQLKQSARKESKEKPDQLNSKELSSPQTPYGREIHDDYAILRENYQAPKYPIVLAHGLLGFEELRLVPNLPGLKYWRGITEALAKRGIEVIVTAVPASGSLEQRAAMLGESIAKRAHGKSVNIIAHSMGGLDSRYMISQLKPPNVDVLSLTTIATPHHGSAFADYMFEAIGPIHLPRLYKILDFFGMETGAFSQLTREYMQQEFNPKTPDLPGVQYYSYGASLEPNWWSVFRPSHNIIKRLEGAPNDGLVSVPSSMWGEYKGTLIGCSHLDLINWTNRLKWYLWSLTGTKRNFNAVAFYLDICDMLAKEGL